MNYRHAYHAGNPSDVFKHAALVLLIERLKRKASPLCYIDTHAGRGRYDLRAAAAQKTGEFRSGIGRLLAAEPAPALASYRALIEAAQPAHVTEPATLSSYPGSPALAQALLRPQDRLILMELHPEDAAALRMEFRQDVRVHVHHRDGYEGLKAFLPPPERRGLVLIDPPFENRDEMPYLVDALTHAHGRWPTGHYALWYPIKEPAVVRRFHSALAGSGIRKILAVELLSTPDQPLKGSGLILVNPPWQIEPELEALLTALKRGLNVPDAASAIEWLAPE